MFSFGQDLAVIRRHIEERVQLEHVEVEGLVAEEMGVKPVQTVGLIHALEHEREDFRLEHEEAGSAH